MSPLHPLTATMIGDFSYTELYTALNLGVSQHPLSTLIAWAPHKQQTGFQKAVMSYQHSFPEICHSPIFMALELATESAEAAEKMKKIVRSNGGDCKVDSLTAEQRLGVADELGDALCCIHKLAAWLEVPIETIEKRFLAKMDSRIKRNVQLGSGDGR